MFRNRRNSQKPSDELYRNFKANFPVLNQSVVGTSAPGQVATSLAEALDITGHHRPIDAQPHDLKDADPTQRDSDEHWNFGTSGLTPSMMDPNSQSFNMFANQMPGYYTPTPGGTSTLYHNQAGDLHTPGLAMGLSTPLSLPTSEGSLNAGHQAAAFHGYHPHMPQHMQSQPFTNLNPFHMHHQPGFPPQQFTHQPTFDHVDGHIDESPIDDMTMDVHMHHAHHSPEMLFHSQSLAKTMQPPSIHPSGEQFRYHVTLNAPTAMIKHADEIPVTYLNKGQAYTLNVVDTQQKPGAHLQYRTFVRVSFEDEQQRQKPAACWQLWKEGRGTNEAHQRGGRLQAVEYVESGQVGNTEDPSKPRIDLECASFDGFCVVWSPPNGGAQCPISVRFNFLSTDFSHSKGVKGIPVRLCTKTEVIGEIGSSTQGPVSEVCYCKVKLFRDHGAERKLSNDIQHVKKQIDKLNQQIAQIESGMRDLGKRKRSGSVAKASLADNRPGKVPKHRRTWSMSSVTSNSGRGSAEEDLHVKLMTLNDMFSSTRPQSVLYLRGAEEDDPDLHPVKLTGEAIELLRNDSTETAAWERQSTQSSVVSPTPSSNSLNDGRRDSSTQQQSIPAPPVQQPTPYAGASRVNSSEWVSQPQPQTAIMDLLPTVSNPQQLASPPENQPVKIQTRSASSTHPSGWIEAVGVDQNYEPPPEPAIKPVACFYIQPRVVDRRMSDNFYRAIYIYRRTLKDFTNAIASRSNIEPTQVLRTVRVGLKDLPILLDDEYIRQLPEGQDMVAEFNEFRPGTPSRPTREWDAGPTDVQCDGELPTVENVSSTGYELRLFY